ncbi:SAM-dependent methyltransferase [Cronobacter dublinensis 582]|nr:SAM-dependent methyltransferase [Cronobacter dublinensis 582]
MLAQSPLPDEADIWWMSQFLDCFSPEQIVAMLTRVAGVMKPGAHLCVMELFWDAQKFEAASFSLNASSLYFTCMANGNSRFYSVVKFTAWLEAAGFNVKQQIDHLGTGHTLLICQKT